MAQTRTSPSSVPGQDGRSYQNPVLVDPSIAEPSPTYATHGAYSDASQLGNSAILGSADTQPRPNWTGYRQQFPPLLLLDHHTIPPNTVFGQAHSLLPTPGNKQKRPRRPYGDIVRMYKCGWNGCEKAYGTLNHLNTHVTIQSHGQRRTSEDPTGALGFPLKTLYSDPAQFHGLPQAQPEHMARQFTSCGQNLPKTVGTQKARKVLQACDHCRSLKRKCDGTKPCKNCVNMNRTCRYQVQEPRKPRKPKNSADEVQALRDEVQALKDKLRDMASRLEEASNEQANAAWSRGASIFNPGGSLRLLNDVTNTMLAR